MAIKKKDWRNVAQKQLDEALADCASKDYESLTWYHTPKGSGFHLTDSNARPLRWFAFGVYSKKQAYKAVKAFLRNTYGKAEMKDFVRHYKTKPKLAK